MNNDLMFSSETDKWDTPADLVADLATVFDWHLDVCASRPNVCGRFFSEADNGLVRQWWGLCWMNPPYGRTIGNWVRKAVAESQEDIWPGTAVVCLLPARTDTRWWQDNVPYATQVVFIRGRLKFGSDDAWIAAHQENIMKQNGTIKQIGALTRKIGGKLCEEKTLVKLAGYAPFFGRNKNFPSILFSKWLELDHLKKDHAPFPSAFVVFGHLNDEQREKLASYGMSCPGWSKYDA